MAQLENSIISVALGPGVRAGFTTRHGGSSGGDYASLNLGHHVGDDAAAVATNRAKVSSWLGAPVQFAEQVHGDTAALITQVGQVLPEADALITTQPGAGLAIMVADCCPILLADPQAGIIAGIHAGRAGLLKQIVPQVVQLLRSLGAHQLVAAIGPTICGQCYEVPASLARQAHEQIPASVATTRWQSPGIDIAGGVRAQLETAGVQADTSALICPYESPDFFSHRRATHEGGVTGRFAGIISLGT